MKMSFRIKAILNMERERSAKPRPEFLGKTPNKCCTGVLLQAFACTGRYATEKCLY
jgi:hypothetical protein